MSSRPTDDFHVYDTTLRDGAQQEGLAFSVADKLAVAAHLDELGVGFVEGGWPGANPKDTEFFRRARTELDLKTAQLAAFGATRRPGAKAADDPQVAALRESGAPVVTLVAKSHDRHVELALRTTLEENIAMVRDTVTHLRAEGQRVFLDAEHFFDGYLSNSAYALEVLRTAAEAGADVLVLCDTNGGRLPDEVADVVHTVREATAARLGIHCHNDAGCAVANSLAAVDAGASHVQGTLNGYGERTGNADILTVVANLELKKDRRVLPSGALGEATRIAHAVSELANVPPYSRQPYVGVSAFAHKAGLHASAVRVDPMLYQHEHPEAVGNDMRMLVSDMAGRASIELKGRELGYDLAGNDELLGRVTDKVKEMESRGYTFEAADASFELLLREAVEGAPPDLFDVESWRVIVDAQRRRLGCGGGDGEGARRRGADRRRGGGQRPGQRPRPGPAHRSGEGLSGAHQARADRLPGPHRRRRARDRRGHPGARRDERRRDVMGDGRRPRQHHRGVLGGAARRRDLRSAAPPPLSTAAP